LPTRVGVEPCGVAADGVSTENEHEWTGHVVGRSLDQPVERNAAGGLDRRRLHEMAVFRCGAIERDDA
jgi:hypothetical protein